MTDPPEVFRFQCAASQRCMAMTCSTPRNSGKTSNPNSSPRRICLMSKRRLIDGPGRLNERWVSQTVRRVHVPRVP